MQPHSNSNVDPLYDPHWQVPTEEYHRDFVSTKPTATPLRSSPRIGAFASDATDTEYSNIESHPNIFTNGPI